MPTTKGMPNKKIGSIFQAASERWNSAARIRERAKRARGERPLQ
jgi:hypothetical protein